MLRSRFLTVSSLSRRTQATTTASSPSPPLRPSAPLRPLFSQTVNLAPPRLDYRGLLEHHAAIASNARLRNASVSTEQIELAVELAGKRRTLSPRIEGLRTELAKMSEKVRRKEARPEEAKEIKAELKRLEPELARVEMELAELVVQIPNETHSDVPRGPEDAAITIDSIGPSPPLHASDPNRDHLIVGRELRIIDFEAAQEVTGGAWYFLRGAGAVLEQALQSFALGVALKHGFEATSCPDVVRSDIARRCGFQPRDRDGSSQSFHLQPLSQPDPASSPPSSSSPSSPCSPQLSLAATAEIPLAGSLFGRTFYPSELPHRMVGLGKAFRTEMGKGRDVRGLYRVHQFSKVEMFVTCTEDESEREMERLREVQTEIARDLGLSVRVLDMPTEELGAAAYRKYDMEAWMPGRGTWGEISSLSNCTSYQARRLLISYKTPLSDAAGPTSRPTTFAHMLNGTAAAIPRLIVALIENGVVLSTDPVSPSPMPSPSSSLSTSFPPPTPPHRPNTPTKKGQDSYKVKKVVKAKGGEEERKERLDDGVEILAMRLPSALRRHWVGQDEWFGPTRIRWI